MTLLDSKKGCEYKIKSINCSQNMHEDLLQRFYAMGIYEGSVIAVQHVSAFQQSYSINIYGTQVALRKSEAHFIEIEPHIEEH